jgi:hypothetical protein
MLIPLILSAVKRQENRALKVTTDSWSNCFMLMRSKIYAKESTLPDGLKAD